MAKIICFTLYKSKEREISTYISGIEKNIDLIKVLLPDWGYKFYISAILKEHVKRLNFHEGEVIFMDDTNKHTGSF
ncbi:hypothetical protein [Desulfocicer niacini]